MQPQSLAHSFSLAVRLSSDIRRLEKTLARLAASNARRESDVWHRQLLERALTSKRAQLDYLISLED